MKRILSRRAMLRGLGGATIALPTLEIMLNSHGTALAGGAALPKRFLTYLFGNGVILNRWVPAATGATWSLTTELAPLAPVKSYCNVLSGFKNHMPVITHHEGMAGMWSGHPYIPNGGLNSNFGGPSIDQVAADFLAPGASFRSIEIGVSKRVSENEGPTMQFLSHRASDQPQPPEYNPRALWSRLFNDTGTIASRGSRLSVLDAVKEDARALQRVLGRADRDRLEAHLTSVNELQDQIASLVTQVVPEPTEDNTDVGGSEPMPAVADAMNQLLLYAFKTDLTRVASYMLTGGVGFSVFSHLGHSTEQHNLSHLDGGLEPLHETIVWCVQQFSNLLQLLAAEPEGAGNLLDQTVAVLGSDCSEGWYHGNEDMPVIIAGGGGGSLVNPGIHFRAASSERNLSDVLLTALRAVNPGQAEVGSGVGLSTTPVTEILT